jgi:phenylacetate-CoA ligase
VKKSRLITKINETIEIATQNTFYRGRISKIHCLEDMNNMPILTKEMLLKLSPSDFLENCSIPLYEYHESSGTTNEPLITWFSRNDFMSYVEQLNESAVNIGKNDIVLIRFPYALSVPAHTFTQLVHKNGGCVIHAGRGDNHCTFIKAIEVLRCARATILACNVQEAFNLAYVAQAAGYDLKEDFNLRAICTAGEVLTNARKKRLEELFKIPVYNFYGTTELGNLGVTKEDETLYASTDHFYFEVLDPLNYKPVPYGEKGILYVTTLSKEIFPFIRYCTGDVVSISPNKKPDDRHLLELKHFGRYNDVIRYGEKLITFAEIQNALLELSDEMVGNMWRIRRLDNCLEFIVESDIAIHENTEKITLNLDIPYKFKYVPKGTIFDSQKYVREKVIGKPEYFIK